MVGADLSYLMDSLNRYYYETCDLYHQNQDLNSANDPGCAEDCSVRATIPTIRQQGTIFYPIIDVAHRM